MVCLFAEESKQEPAGPENNCPQPLPAYERFQKGRGLFEYAQSGFFPSIETTLTRGFGVMATSAIALRRLPSRAAARRRRIRLCRDSKKSSRLSLPATLAAAAPSSTAGNFSEDEELQRTTGIIGQEPLIPVAGEPGTG